MDPDVGAWRAVVIPEVALPGAGLVSPTSPRRPGDEDEQRTDDNETSQAAEALVSYDQQLCHRIIHDGPATMDVVRRYGITGDDILTPEGKALWDTIKVYYTHPSTQGSVLGPDELRRRHANYPLPPPQRNLTVEALCHEVRLDRIRGRGLLALGNCASAIGTGALDVGEQLQKCATELNTLARIGSSQAHRWYPVAACAEPLPAARWIVDGLIQVGPTVLLAGYGDSMKSLGAQCMLLSLAAAAAEHLVWGMFPRAKAFVCCHLDYEQGVLETWRRYRALAKGMSLDLATVNLQITSSPESLTLANRAFFENCATGCDVVLVDSFAGARGAIDENSAEARQTLDMLNSISEATGCTFVVIHHSAKGKKDDPREVARGSSAIFDAAGAMLAFVVGTEKGEVRVSHAKFRGGNKHAPFVLRVEDTPSGGITVLAQAVDAAPHDDIVAMTGAVISRLEQSGGSWTGSVFGLKKELGVSNRKHEALQTALIELQRAGRMSVVRVPGSGQKTTFTLAGTRSAIGSAQVQHHVGSVAMAPGVAGDAG